MYKNKKIFILGMARSGYEVAKLLAKDNKVFITDMKEQDEALVNELKKLKKSNKLLNLSEIEPYVKRFSNYEDALKYRDNLLTLFKGVNYLTIVDYIKRH